MLVIFKFLQQKSFICFELASSIPLTTISLGVDNFKLNSFACLSSCVNISYTAESKLSSVTRLRLNLIDEESNTMPQSELTFFGKLSCKSFMPDMTSSLNFLTLNSSSVWAISWCRLLVLESRAGVTRTGYELSVDNGRMFL